MANILIADSDAGIRNIIVEALHDTGHKFYQADDGNSAMEVIRQETISVVLADRELTTAEGAEILKEIKKIRPQISVVVLTGFGDEDSEEMLDAGAFATVSKPFNVQEIKRIVSEAVPVSLQELTQMKPGRSKEKSRARRKTVLALGLAALVLIAVGSGVGFWFWQRVPPVRIFAVPYSHLSGLAFDGQSLWSCDWFNQEIYQHSLDPILSLTRAFRREDFHPTGIAWDGKNLWSVAGWKGKILRHKSSDPAFVENEISVPTPDLSCLFYDGEFFWTCDARQAKIIQFTIEGGRMKVLVSANSPGLKPIGIYKDKKFVWTADNRSGLIYKHNIDQNFKVIEVYALPQEFQKEKIGSFAADGKRFWVGTEATQKIYQFHKRHLKLVGEAD